MVEIALPDSFTRRVAQCWGAPGTRWLADLPEIATRVLHDWDLHLDRPCPLSLNWVTRVRRADGSAAVLKMGIPGADHLSDEAAALEFFAGRGAVSMLAHDAARGAILLEEVRPGRPARSLVPDRDEDATAALIGVIRGLHRPAPPGIALPELAARRATFDEHLRRFPDDGPLPRHLVERAGRLLTELCETAIERVVLHGDLHHDNVLAAGREPWLVIDPHGLTGDPGYEIGAMLYNPYPMDDDTVLRLVPGRIEQLADGLDIPIERVVAWGFVQAVLSEVWNATGDGIATGRPLRLASLLLPRLP
ncbi:aminoglycoside/hydroxyurea antibiotic resistance kinase [Actinoplanes sp. SE50]|uniref:aminoglycoside phosphotransferase family protein n=1 Tax=unclassified Actinoplanes TaxID=2626549 RepID=UPI00023EBC32|nr:MULTISPECIES: aminoglycoside phosphotransferase family protein [unclassified Actinoplanes]AEV87389.1 aminoglycoside/hydroxyurea antibiotic resistance kinase [Actinoplanes sp. SE50/110]ATO85791.1 aminoglycoside/hydroxyurea antibiotic resistance kinase [Actinoplanes sp. SE50]SLM03204.1 aminoglycoside/hydroxyurea antibiotic resistance kinase [Actinoplanes sp. SE50/110]